MDFAENCLFAEDLQKSFQGRRVVDGLTIGLAPSEVVGLLGPNGAGKTTSFNMIMGLLRADSGRILVRGQDVTAWPLYQRARAGIGYLAQEPSVFRRLTVRDNLGLYLEVQGTRGAAARARIDELLAEFDLGKVASAFGATLSGGERRRLEIARAMSQRPAFLLLDEPFSGIDPLAVEEVRRQILRLAAAGVGLLMTDHNVRETLSTCHRAYIVKDGRTIVEGTPSAIAGSERARTLYLGERFRLDEAS